MPQQQQRHKYLTNSVFIVIVCGLILAYIGNYLIRNSNDQQNGSNITTCDKSILIKLSEQNNQERQNGYIIAFTGNLATGFGILFLLLLSSLFSLKNSDNTEGILSKIKNRHSST